MFHGKMTNVTLQAENGMAGILIDRFGKDIKMVPIDDDHFEVSVDVAVSKQFYGWLLGLGTDIILTAPTSVVEGFKKHLQDVGGIYLK